MSEMSENWKGDFKAAISVALIALPLSMGIAMAAKAPPMAGIFSAIIGGVVTTLYRGGHVSVNGPAKGVIGVILMGLYAMDDGTGQAFNYILAAVVVSGALQVLMGLLKFGRLADIFHSTVIHGILAAIGIIILGKQIHEAMGTYSDSKKVLYNLIDAIVMVPQANPFVVTISLVGLLIILFHPKMKWPGSQILPTPMWVIIASIGFTYAFDLFHPHTRLFLNRSYELGPKLLLQLPENLLDSIVYPNFAKMNTPIFWVTAISIFLISSIESLTIAKAIDKIDPLKRKTDLNKDLTGIGLSTIVAGMIGGLPIIAVIIRSKVNVLHGAKSKWSNFYQGILVLIFIVVLSPVMRMVPLCAFAILLVHSGFKLASPKVFKNMYSHGYEQLLIFVCTMLLTLLSDNLLIGLLGGLLIAFVIHLFLTKMSPVNFVKMLRAEKNIIETSPGHFELKINGIANFLNFLKIDKLVSDLPDGSHVKINFSNTRFVGITVLEELNNYKELHEIRGGKLEIVGLENHKSSTQHLLGAKVNLAN